MTPRNRELVEIAVKVGGVVIGVSVAWTMLTGAVQQLQQDKLDAVRFERDSARRDARWSQREEFERQQRRDMDLVICRLIPQELRCEQR